MKFKKTIFLVSISIFLCSLLIVNTSAQKQTPITTNVTQKQLNDQFLLALNWMQHSGEYAALTYQAFNTAKIAFDQALDQKIINPAVVVDLDETILDNSPYQASLIGQEQGFANTTWNQWVKAAQAKAIPGSVDFINYVNSHGGKVFFVSNRSLKSDQKLLNNDLELATIQNLNNLGITGVDEQTVVLKEEFPQINNHQTSNDKESRRQAIITGKIDGQKHHIVVLVGDNLNDFAHAFEITSNNQERQLSVTKNVEQFGISENNIFPKYIIIPNPVYGDWEAGLYNPSLYHKQAWYQLSPAEKDTQRRQSLIKFKI